MLSCPSLCGAEGDHPLGQLCGLCRVFGYVRIPVKQEGRAGKGRDEGKGKEG